MQRGRRGSWGISSRIIWLWWWDLNQIRIRWISQWLCRYLICSISTLHSPRNSTWFNDSLLLVITCIWSHRTAKERRVYSDWLRRRTLIRLRYSSRITISMSCIDSLAINHQIRHCWQKSVDCMGITCMRNMTIQEQSSSTSILLGSWNHHMSLASSWMYPMLIT